MATDIEKLKIMASDTIMHKKYVLETCLIMAKYLMDNSKIKLANDLLIRAAEHDNSKFEYQEFRKLSQILKNRKCFTDATSTLSKEEISAIKEHWKKNRHHPEYFDNYDDMTELDIIEMVCDWFARSLQYNTDFLPFIEERQKVRFNFSTKQYNKIHDYCNLIQSLYNKHKKDA